MRERGARPSAKIGSATTNNVGPGGRDHWPEYHSFLIAGAIVAIVRTPEFEVVTLFVVSVGVMLSLDKILAAGGWSKREADRLMA